MRLRHEDGPHILLYTCSAFRAKSPGSVSNLVSYESLAHVRPSLLVLILRGQQVIPNVVYLIYEAATLSEWMKQCSKCQEHQWYLRCTEVFSAVHNCSERRKMGADHSIKPSPGGGGPCQLRVCETSA